MSYMATYSQFMTLTLHLDRNRSILGVSLPEKWLEEKQIPVKTVREDEHTTCIKGMKDCIDCVKTKPIFVSLYIRRGGSVSTEFMDGEIVYVKIEDLGDPKDLDKLLPTASSSRERAEACNNFDPIHPNYSSRKLCHYCSLFEVCTEDGVVL